MNRSSELYNHPRRNKVLWFFLLGGILTVSTSTSVSATGVNMPEVPALVDCPANILTGAIDLSIIPFHHSFYNQVQPDVVINSSLRLWHHQSAVAVLVRGRACRYLKFRPIPMDILTCLNTTLPDPR